MSSREGGFTINLVLKAGDKRTFIKGMPGEEHTLSSARVQLTSQHSYLPHGLGVLTSQHSYLFHGLGLLQGQRLSYLFLSTWH